MRVYLGSDHAGFELKAHLVGKLTEWGHEAIDVGPVTFDSEDDYPGFCIAAARRVAADEGSLGVVIGGSGNGEQISANKVSGIRAALVWSVETAQLAREHNDAQVAGIGARMHSLDQAADIIKTFVQTPFSGIMRHQRRINILSEYERTGVLPGMSSV